MSGRTGDSRLISTEQEEKLREFRIAIQDVMRPDYDDYFLLRWLRARKFDVPAAEKMLRKCLEWREYVEADTILDYEFPEIVHKYLPASIVGHDKEGHPVWIIPFENLDLHGWLGTDKLRTLLLKYIIFCAEKTMQDLKIQSKKLGKQIELIVAIFDLDGISTSQIPWRATIKLLEDCLAIYEAYYPETLKVAYIINFPWFCDFVFPLVRMILSPDTQKRLQFFSKGSDWKNQILKEIDPSELPKHWGGTKVDPDGDPKCPSILRFAGKLPTMFYKMSVSEFLSERPQCKTAIVPKSTIWDVSVVVEENGSVLEWKFMTETRDIGFGVFLKAKNNSKINEEGGDNHCSKEEETSLIPIQRVQSHLVPENGVHKCKIKGTYILKFDNSHSWFYAKKLHYSISVTPPTSVINKRNNQPVFNNLV